MSRSQGPEVSVIVLCYRAEEEARRLAQSLYDDLERSGIGYELVLVANYWPRAEDRTRELVRDFARGRPTVATVARAKEGDMGWDMRSGLREASGEFLIVIDGDGQVPPAYALEAYRLLKETGADIVKGRRWTRADGLVRSLNSLTYNAAFRLLFGTRGLWDINGRPKGLTRAAYERLSLVTDDWFTDAEIVLKARREGLEIREMPVRFLEKPAGRSFVGFAAVWEFIRNMTLWRLGRHPAIRGQEQKRTVPTAPALRAPR